MSDVGRREARIITGICLTLGGLAVASSVSPSLEAFLNLWVGVPVLLLGLAALAAVLVRQAWLSLLIEWELHRTIRPEELVQRETEEV